MAYEIFDGDETGFDDWVKTHPFGVVINSSPGRLNADYLKAHRPECSTIQRHTGSKTVYSKHCFDSAEEAIRDLAGRGIPRPSFGCTVCKVGVLEPTSDSAELDQRVQALLGTPFGSPPAGNVSPERSVVSATISVKRDPAIVAWVRNNANGKCELCMQTAPFLDDRGRPYLEVHHVVTLANSGPDTVGNTVALCPNCHRAMHLSSDKAALVDRIYAQVARLVRNP